MKLVRLRGLEVGSLQGKLKSQLRSTLYAQSAQLPPLPSPASPGPDPRPRPALVASSLALRRSKSFHSAHLWSFERLSSGYQTSFLRRRSVTGDQFNFLEEKDLSAQLRLGDFRKARSSKLSKLKAKLSVAFGVGSIYAQASSDRLRLRLRLAADPLS